MTQSYIQFDKTSFGTAFNIKENPFVFADSEEFISGEFQRLLEKKEECRLIESYLIKFLPKIAKIT